MLHQVPECLFLFFAIFAESHVKRSHFGHTMHKRKMKRNSIGCTLNSVLTVDDWQRIVHQRRRLVQCELLAAEHLTIDVSGWSRLITFSFSVTMWFIRDQQRTTLVTSTASYQPINPASLYYMYWPMSDHWPMTNDQFLFSVVHESPATKYI